MDLEFNSVQYGDRELPWSLEPLLYKGAARLTRSAFESSRAAGTIGSKVEARIPLLTRLHEILEGDFVSGGSRHTLRARVIALRRFYDWADKQDLPIDLESSEYLVCDWSHALLLRVRNGEIKPVSLTTDVSRVCALLDRVLDRGTPLYRSTQASRLSRRQGSLFRKADRLLLTDTYRSGAALLDIVNALPVGAVLSASPPSIIFRDDHFGRDAAPDPIPLKRWSKRSVLNLRIEAEMLIFIAQTGMNLAQANRMSATRFRYRTFMDGYLVRRAYKARRQGEVEFTVYKEYRAHLENYLIWREHFFKDDDRLFPHSSPSNRSRDVAPLFRATKALFERKGLPFTNPSKLRKARVNWLKRASNDPNMAAEMAQHSVETLLAAYDVPDHQTSAVEITRFHLESEAALEAPAPGFCGGGIPASTDVSPRGAPSPDCISPSGCLFCKHHRDVDSFDHVWSLTSYMHLKIVEVARLRAGRANGTSHPARLTVDRIASKILDFESTDALRATWVKEARERVMEEHFHPKWDGFIQLAEARL